MKVLVTGAKGFVGRNLCESLKNIRDGKDRRGRFEALKPLEVCEYDVDGTPEELDAYCAEADFVFNLAGVNRPKDSEDYMKGNFGFASELLACLKHHGNACPVMLSSSVQATLRGRYAGSAYGKSKLAGEELFFDYAARTGAKVLVYRFPNLYGKWCRPHYNSAVATFCDAVANGRDFHVDDPSTKLELLYVDDLVRELLGALLGEEHRCRYEGMRPVADEDGPYCYVPQTDVVTLGDIVGLLEEFKAARGSLNVPNVEEGSFSKKLYSTYESYLEPENLSFQLAEHEDARGSFTELLRTPDRGQVSVNVIKPGAVKGQHWHHSKWEKFYVVSGEALVRVRKVGLDSSGGKYPAAEYRISDKDAMAVEIPPGYAHSIVNPSDSQDLVTIIWSNEVFDQENPDTYREEV